MCQVTEANLASASPKLIEKFKSMKPVSWTVIETLAFSPKQKLVCNLIANNFTWNEVSVIAKISSPNTISTIIRLSALSIPFVEGRQGGSYSVFSETVVRSLSNKVAYRRKGLNCLKTHEAKQLILEEIEEIRQRGLKRLNEWGSERLIPKFISDIEEAVLTDDIFRELCQRSNIFILSDENLELIRRKCCNFPAIERFYSVITDIVVNMEPKYKFNADETCLSSKRIFSILTDDKMLRVTVNEQERSHISCMLCYSEEGTKLKPMFIFPKRESPFEELEDIPDILIGTSAKGWMTGHLWDIWCIYFVSHITLKRLSNDLDPFKPVVLFVDGHLSRLSPFGMRLLAQYNIICIVFPSHSSHILQPFDVGAGGRK